MTDGTDHASAMVQDIITAAYEYGAQVGQIDRARELHHETTPGHLTTETQIVAYRDGYHSTNPKDEEVFDRRRLFTSVSVLVARFAVTGTHPLLGSGILSWHIYETQAAHNAAYLNKHGGQVRAIPARAALAG